MYIFRQLMFPIYFNYIEAWVSAKYLNLLNKEKIITVYGGEQIRIFLLLNCCNQMSLLDK